MAKSAGFFYLLTFLTVIPIGLSGRLIARGDADATAANILAHQSLFGLGFAFELFQLACYIAVTALFYQLFKPVSRSISLVAAFLSVLGCAIQAAAYVFYLAPLVVLREAPYLSAFTSEQTHGIAYLFLNLNLQGYDIGLVFFGCYCFLIGYLIIRSTFLPGILGVLMALAGLGYLTFFVPAFASGLVPYNLIPGLIGEGALTFWLLAFGVNEQRWLNRQE